MAGVAFGPFPAGPGVIFRVVGVGGGVSTHVGGGGDLSPGVDDVAGAVSGCYAAIGVGDLGAVDLIEVAHGIVVQGVGVAALVDDLTLLAAQVVVVVVDGVAFRIPGVLYIATGAVLGDPGAGADGLGLLVAVGVIAVAGDDVAGVAVVADDGGFW